jgi:hypothetical protein
MEIIYRTFDGLEFDNEADACYHEACAFEGIKMWNREGKLVEETSSAFVLYLENEAANEAFFTLADKQGDHGIDGLIRGGDYGLFIWNECSEAYHFVSDDEILALTAAGNYLNSRKDAE